MDYRPSADSYDRLDIKYRHKPPKRSEYGSRVAVPTPSPTLLPAAPAIESSRPEVALPISTGLSATLGDGLAEVCQRSASSYDDGAADGTAGLASRKVHAPVHSEAASSTSVPARSADNGPGIHNVKIAVGA